MLGWAPQHGQLLRNWEHWFGGHAPIHSRAFGSCLGRAARLHRIHRHAECRQRCMLSHGVGQVICGLRVQGASSLVAGVGYQRHTGRMCNEPSATSSSPAQPSARSPAALPMCRPHMQPSLLPSSVVTNAQVGSLPSKHAWRQAPCFSLYPPLGLLVPGGEVMCPHMPLQDAERKGLWCGSLPHTRFLMGCTTAVALQLIFLERRLHI